MLFDTGRVTDHDPPQPSRDDLYDAYVEAALAGRAAPPAEYVAQHGVDDAELLGRLHALHDAARRAVGTAAASDDLPFIRLGPYRVLRRLDEGGMGMVYLGVEERLGRLVALKVLRPEFQGSATQAARFEREAQVVARLRHPGIVTIFGVGEEGGVRFLAMEYVEGEGLDEVIARAAEERRPLAVAMAVRWAIQVAGALDAAHQVGVVHRDVKPSNVRIGPDGNAILLDFGIAAEEGTSRLTVAGGFLGTAAYAAPEQLRPKGDVEADGRADVYSLGVVLYEALTGVQPFDGASEMDTAERVMGHAAQPARRLRRDLPRDLETVLQVAMERNPGRRYASATALAADLRAVLEIRPIEARRPGPVRRAVKLARRHPAATAALVIGALAVIGAFGAENLRRRRAASEALEEARSGVRDFRTLCEDSRTAEELYRHLDGLLESRHMTAEDEVAFADAGRRVHTSRREREAEFHAVLSALRRAERLRPGMAGLDDVRASLYVERWREARTIHDDDTATFYRRLALALSPTDELAAQLQGTARVRVRCDTPGATARLFRWELLSEIAPGGEPRLVPVPIGGEPTLPPGAWAFRAVTSGGGLDAGDLILSVDGHAPAPATWSEQRARLAGDRSGTAVTGEVTGKVPVEVLRRSGRATLRLRPGAALRLTTQPLEWVAGAEALVPAGVECPSGAVLIVTRAPGHEESRVVISLRGESDADVTVRLLPAGTTPAGFVRIAPPATSNVASYWIQEREVTAAEYLVFLNSEESRAAIDAAERPILYPRNRATEGAGGHWPRNAAGRYGLPDDGRPDWPVTGISFEDAAAYCRWWTRRARSRGEPFVAALPTLREWTHAAQPTADRLFVYGNRFHPKWANGCFSRAAARIEPVLGYPRDESVYGVFDLSGSAWEWTDAWWDEEKGLRRVSGGSWARAPREFFKVWGGLGFAPDFAGDENGFRLVLRRGDTERE